MVHQTSSSLNSSDAEVAELAGCSIEDSSELKRRVLEQQTVATNGTVLEADSRDDLGDSPSSEEEVNGGQ